VADMGTAFVAADEAKAITSCDPATKKPKGDRNMEATLWLVGRIVEPS